MPNTRLLAISALREIWLNNKKPKHTLEPLSEPLEKRDRAFLMEMVYGVLRYRDTIDLTLKKFLRRPSGLNPDTLNNLRLAAYQILFMRVPEWAAVNEAVEIEKKRGKPELVNAVLRSFLRNLGEIDAELSALKKRADAKGIALSTSHPEWLIKRWIERFGYKNARALTEANNIVPPLTLRVNTLKAKREDVIERLKGMGIHAEPAQYSPDGIRLNEFHIFKELHSLRGLVIAQDEASQLVSYLLEPEPGDRALDACAAPGGKTTHIAQIMLDKGEITAVDADETRIPRLKQNIADLGVSSVSVIHADIAESGLAGPFDRILLDAPCSSIGVIRRNPDIKYKHTAKDLKKFSVRQVRMLFAASRLLRPGGVMVYSVCSTEPEEGEGVIKEFLKDSGDFYIIDSSLPFLKGFMKDGFFRTYPHINNMDGFFGARLCKKS